MNQYFICYHEKNSEKTSDSLVILKTDDLDKTIETPEKSNLNNEDQNESNITKSSSINRTKSMHNEPNISKQNSIERSSDFNSADSINSATKTHKKQHSMSNESFQQVDRKFSNLSTVNRRAIKKNRVSLLFICYVRSRQTYKDIAKVCLIRE